MRRHPALRRSQLELLESRDTPATFTWDGGGGADHNWATGLNWVGDTAPTGLVGTLDDLVFDATATQRDTNNNLVAAVFNSIKISETGYTLNGNALTLGSVAAGTGSITDDAPSGASGAIVLNIQLSNATTTHTVTINSGVTLTINGVVSGPASAGLTKAGAGALILTNDNTYAGGSTVSAGTLGIGGGAAGGSVVGDIVNNGAVLFNRSDSTTFYNGAISGSGSVAWIGTGILRFAGAVSNSYAGTTTVSAGTLELGKTGGAIAVPGPLVVNGGIARLEGPNQIADSATVRVSNNAILHLNIFDDTFGTLTLGDTAGGDGGIVFAGTSSSGNVLHLNGNIVREIGATPITAQIIGRIDLNGGARTFDVADGPQAVELDVTAAVIGTGSIVKTGAGALQFSGGADNTYNGTTTVNGGILNLNRVAGVPTVPGALVVGDGAGADIVRTFNNNLIADAAAITVNPGATFDINGKSETVGPVSVTGGTVSLGLNGALTIGGALTVSGSTITGGTVALGGNVSALASATPITIFSGINLNGATRTFDVAAGGAGVDHLTLAGAVQGGGSGLTKTGAGTLVLAGGNTYTGTTTINAGTVRVAGTQPGSPIALTGGTLGGGGTIGSVTGTGGTIKPGLVTAPIALATGNLTLGASTYAPVLTDNGGGISDLLTVVGSVNLTGAMLSPTRIGAAPASGRAFLLIANDGNDAVTGTFTGLPEGGAVTAGGIGFTITYHGNDGNDVVLVPSGKSPPTSPPLPGGANGAPLVVGGRGNGTVAVFTPNPATGGYSTTPAAILAPFGTAAVNVRTAVGDINGDGKPDAVLVTGPGVPVRVAVLSGADNTTLLVPAFDPFGGDFTGGGFVAAADLDGDGRAEFIATPDRGGGPRVAAFSLNADGTTTRRINFLGIDDSNFRGGCRAAAGDVNGDGIPELVVCAGFLGGPRTAIFDGRTLTATPTRVVNDFFAFPGTDSTSLRNGVFVAAGDINGDGFADLIFGGGPGGAPRVFILSGKLVSGGDVAGSQTNPIANFFVAGNSNDRGGVRVAAVNDDGDGRADLVIGSGEGSPARIRSYLGTAFTSASEPSVFQEQTPFDGAVLADGVFVG